MSASRSSQELLLQLYQHVVLPRDVPGKEDRNTSAIDTALISRIIDSVKMISELVPREHFAHVDAVRSSLVTSKKINADGMVNKDVLAKEIDQLVGYQALVLYVKEQNAALLLYKDTRHPEMHLVFEAFETSAACEAVLASENALRWDFPRCAVAVPQNIYCTQSFQENFAAFIERACIEALEQFATMTYKSGVSMPEIRGTTDPSLITGFLMTVLEYNGKKLEVPLLQKRVRDEVSWNNARKPWRRSPFYLVLRVTIQRHLYQILDQNTGMFYYKAIMALFLARLLEQSCDLVPHEATFSMMQKLGRRLSKIEQLRSGIPKAMASKRTRDYLDYEWKTFQTRTRRVIQYLPHQAPDSAFDLQLPSSGLKLRSIASGVPWICLNQGSLGREVLDGYEASRPKLDIFSDLANRNLKVARMVEERIVPAKYAHKLSGQWSHHCCSIAQDIQSYVSSTGDLYDNYSELKSSFLLDLMELWVQMDRHATYGFPLLQSYHPAFTADILDCLELLHLDDMKRVGVVQSYISQRCNKWTGSGSKTIFDPPAEDSFAAMYYDQFGDLTDLKSLREKIETEAAEGMRLKEIEWNAKLEDYNELMEKIETSPPCPGYVEKIKDGELKYVHRSPCTFHYYGYQARQIRIRIFEKPLPDYEPAAKAAIFELRCPEPFAAYRDATWLLLETFGYSKAQPCEKVLVIHDYTKLSHYATLNEPQVTLGSSTKSHLDCHYSESGFPIKLSQVCRPCGLTLKYFDTINHSWTQRDNQVSFLRHTPLILPQNSPYNCISKVNSGDWLSSNDVIASQTKCPSDLNIHEFTAWQGILGGVHRRWLSLLRELGATNLNFSTESTWAVVSRMILQVGPSAHGNSLRDIHMVFEDETFGNKLLELVAYRLDTIRRNWRESIQMNMLTSLLYKTKTMSKSSSVRNKARELLHQVHITTWKWCIELNESKLETQQESTVFTLWASVLCKRAVQLQNSDMFELDSSSLECFLGASIMLRESMVGQFGELPLALQTLLLQDLLYTFSNRRVLKALLTSDQSILLSAVNQLWSLPPGTLEQPPPVMMVPQTWWMEVTIQERMLKSTHIIHYNFLRGDLLINGKQSGILPAEFHEPIVKQLFGTYALRVRPSYQPGMSHFIAQPRPYGHHIHLGLRNGTIVVRAVQKGTTMELIDKAVFSRNVNDLVQYDLPWSLIDNCYHWLDIYSKTLEIRQGNPWKSKNSNWTVNIATSRATKNDLTLVDPFSPLFGKVAQNFLYFEDPQHIVVSQPRNSPLLVELKRLELSFSVNGFHLLRCHQMNAEVAYTDLQDIGTWYGCFSKLVLRSTKNRRQRMVLVPDGRIHFHRYNGHVRITVKSDGSYLRFDVDDILGRIQCPAEHRLLYTKAMWHAYTSHVLDDPLTGRTGLEEAICLLKTGLYKPWTPIQGPKIPSILRNIVDLSPSRKYYPEDLKCMQVIQWNPYLPLIIQDDRYRALIAEIWERNASLQSFEVVPAVSHIPQIPPEDPHLTTRAISRLDTNASTLDLPYSCRDFIMHDVRRSNTATITRILSEWSAPPANAQCLARLMERYPVVGGLDKPWDRTLLSELVSVNLVENWGSIVQTAIRSGADDRFYLMFTFGPMALSPAAPIEMLQILTSYAILPALKSVEFPIWPLYIRFKAEEFPAAKDLADLMQEAHRPHVPVPRKQGELPGQMAMERIKHQEACKHNCLVLTKFICAKWPKAEVELHELPTIDPRFLDTVHALELISTEWKRLTHNFEFLGYLKRIQDILDDHISCKEFLPAKRIMPNGYKFQAPPRYEKKHFNAIPALKDLLCSSELTEKSSRLPGTSPAEDMSVTVSRDLRPLPNGHLSASENAKNQDQKQHSQPSQSKELSRIVEGLKRGDSTRSAASSIELDYACELLDSIKALEKYTSRSISDMPPFNSISLKQSIQENQEACDHALDTISRTLERGDNRAIWLKFAGLWPKMNKLALLSELRSTSNCTFGHGVKEAIVDLGTRITAWQRLLRIEDAFLKQKEQQLQEERKNEGHTNWNPLTRTDWLLLDIDSNVMLRADQIEVANATIAPKSCSNSVVQLLMGKGKTSCILPMVALVLANKKHLLRILVPRALLFQSAQVMHIKLGGLLDRDLIHVPFSRRTRVDEQLLRTFAQLQSDLRGSGGVLLALPEHVLSFKLGGLQRLCDENLQQANIMIKMQRWLENHVRDVLDECDVSLAIRTQLIYPSGSQMAVDGHPLRWQTVQAILRLVNLYVPALLTQFPRSIEVVTRSSGFLLIYLLRHDVEDYLISKLVNAVCEGQLAAIPCADIPESDRDDIRSFISNQRVPTHIVTTINSMFKDKQHVMKILCLLRGLFVHRILISTLKKRWNVQYGLHPTRDPIAVPYHAKGVPSPTSEWGHPDVAIILTCFSFYYQGLDLAQFKQAFEQLLKSDEPSVEYEKWATKDLPGCLRDYTAINVEDSMQLRELHQYIRYSIYLNDFYLNNFVFPRHAKQFETKLQASGWDLVSFDSYLKSTCKTTGFSGTNDTRHQLPMMVKQNDLDDLAHTNAEVLSYLLETRNRGYVLMLDSNGKRWGEENLLCELSKPDAPKSTQRIRVLIDAGAQILEHDNLSLAKLWLKLDWSAAAAVYFDDNHRPWVLYRKGARIPLLATPFAENLEECLVYLDESHCRGTDLKLPPNARAALTLGPHVTKDAVAQAAMRLRLLGQSQAVTFFSPPEVHQSIVDLQGKLDSEQLDSSDVISWLLKQSCNAIEQLEPLYYNQGNTFVQQEQAKLRSPLFLTNLHHRSKYLSVIRTKESQTLKEMYEPKRLGRAGSTQAQSYTGLLGNFATNLEQRKKGFQDSGIAIHSSALEEVEQEREVEHEVENVREPEKPVHFTALKIPNLHKDILEFAKSGNLPTTSSAFQPILSALQRTASGRKHIFSNLCGSGLFVSTQFTRTIKTIEPNDNFIRPCQWILWNPSNNKALIVSPEEADALLPTLRWRSQKKTHLIVYSAPVTRRMLHFNNLSYHATPPLAQTTVVPTWLKIQLGIFAGRLYFEWNEYEELMEYLGAKVKPIEESDEASREIFVQKPLTFLHDWLAVLRKGQDFENTPMGFITTSKPLSADHPFFLNRTTYDLEAEARNVLVGDKAQSNEDDSEDSEDEDVDLQIGEQIDHADDGDEEDNKGRFEEGDGTFFDAVETLEGESSSFAGIEPSVV